jgi:Skp family chaperone for outer membrane proteins
MILVLLLALLLACQSTEVGAFSSSSRFSQHRILQHPGSALSMARPGQSESQAKNDRENEIRQKLAKLKSSGKMKGDASSSIMDEAEKFLNMESPARKFELKMKKRKAEAEAAAAALIAKESLTSEDDSDDDASSPPSAE